MDLSVPQSPRIAELNCNFSDHTYEYPSLPGVQSGNNLTQNAEGGHNASSYHYDDCPAYNLSSDMAAPSEPASMILKDAGSKEESGSIANRASTCLSHSPKQQHLGGKGEEDTIQLEALTSCGQQESSKDGDTIQCSPCPAYSPKPGSEGDNNGESTLLQHPSSLYDQQESSRDIQCFRCPAYSPKPGGELEVNGDGLQEKSKDIKCADAIKCAPCPGYSPTPVGGEMEINSPTRATRF